MSQPRTYGAAVFVLCALAGITLVHAHTVAICYRLDTCTGQYEAAYGTYHSLSQFSTGCPSNPDGRCPSGYSVIDDDPVLFSSLVLSDSDGYPDEPGWAPSDCAVCPTYTTGFAGVQVWQKAAVVLSPGVHSVTVTATSDIEAPWSASCWPLQLSVGGTVSSSITCPPSQAIPQQIYPACSAVASYGSATCSIDAATCPGFTCSVVHDGGPSNGALLPVGTSRVYWSLAINGDVTTQTCSHDITVSDVTAPQNVVCNANVHTTCTGPAGAVATFSDATADDCSLFGWSQTHTSGSVFPIGSTWVTYVASDVYGNQASCTFAVNVGSNPPAWTAGCPANMLVTSFDPSGAFPHGSATVTWTEPTARDGCMNALGVDRTTGPAPGSVFDVVADNPTTVTYVSHPDPVTGHQLTCSFVVEFGYARIARVDQLANYDVDTIAMYIPFVITIEYVNIPRQEADGRLWLSDGVRTINTPLWHGDNSTATFNTNYLEHEFTGPYGMLPGDITLWITVDGNPFFFGNQLPLTLVIDNGL